MDNKTTQDQQPATLETVRILSTIEQSLLHGQAIEAIRTCFDPEIPVNIYEMGLIYGVNVATDGSVLVVMTLTSPSCPAVQSLPKEVETKVKGIPGVTAVAVKVVWEPTWNPGLMSEAAKLELGM